MRLPHADRIWHEMMDHHYPNSAWIRFDRALFDRLCTNSRRREGLSSWEQVIEKRLLARKVNLA